MLRSLTILMLRKVSASPRSCVWNAYPCSALKASTRDHAVRCDEDVVDVDQNICAALRVVLDEQSGFSLGGGITEHSHLVAQPLVPSTGNVLQAVECAVKTKRVADRCHGKLW